MFLFYKLGNKMKRCRNASKQLKMQSFTIPKQKLWDQGNINHSLLWSRMNITCISVFWSFNFHILTHILIFINDLSRRYNEVIVEKQRLEQDVNSLRHFMEEERKEMAELRRQQQVSEPKINKMPPNSLNTNQPILF